MAEKPEEVLSPSEQETTEALMDVSGSCDTRTHLEREREREREGEREREMCKPIPFPSILEALYELMHLQ